MGTTGTIRVTVTVEVTLGGTWGEECTLGQIRAQGSRDAVGHVTTALQGTRARVVEIVANNVTIRQEGAP